MAKYKIRKFPASRIATIDVCEMGKRKHHVTGLIELDVTESRAKIKKYNQGKKERISFTAWLISVISSTLKKYETASSYLHSKYKLIIFEDINVSLVVEKDLQGQKVPIPLVIEKADEISLESITSQIADARSREFTDKDIVLQKKAAKLERLYYVLPGFMRRYFWKYLLKHPKIAYNKMGNVTITALGMLGKVNGWFIPVSVHPVCFGISSIIKKPGVVADKIEVREILKMTILLDHDVMDGANMARFISDLTKNIERGERL
ncbi:MAG: 2-oxo acid dehydrogenase subunit E2 [Candidatus Cloacimonetes bacterium]|nr:2-oxo acid dehydrogenase subunit E2 [Candidatus Cloacimonadota bacterium]